MKVLFVEAKRKFDGVKSENELRKLPKKLHLLYTIQYKDLAEKLRIVLEKKHKVLGFNQVIGCSKIKLKAEPLLIGSGKFHALQIAFSNEKEIYTYEGGKIRKIEKEEIEAMKRKEKGKIAKFFASENIGLLFSLKPGQNKLKEARKLKNKLEKRYKDKNFYLFISNSIDIKELENFNIDFFINFACPGLQFDSARVINYENLI